MIASWGIRFFREPIKEKWGMSIGLEFGSVCAAEEQLQMLFNFSPYLLPLRMRSIIHSSIKIIHRPSSSSQEVIAGSCYPVVYRNFAAGLVEPRGTGLGSVSPTLTTASDNCCRELMIVSFSVKMPVTKAINTFHMWEWYFKKHL